MRDVARASTRRNADVDWDNFPSDAYHSQHYRALREDDLQIVTAIGEFFAAHHPSEGARGLDVGTGSNLYPAFGMLPFCTRLDLVDCSTANVRWLRQALLPGTNHSDEWDAFWQIYRKNAIYARYSDHPLTTLRYIARIRRGNIFDLPLRTWDIGTMFFVSCSMSDVVDEFNRAVASFLDSLKPGAPFAAGFMTNSHGYHVAGRSFPATTVEESAISQALKNRATTIQIIPVEAKEPIRSGVGMTLALGFAT